MSRVSDRFSPEELERLRRARIGDRPLHRDRPMVKTTESDNSSSTNTARYAAAAKAISAIPTSETGTISNVGKNAISLAATGAAFGTTGALVGAGVGAGLGALQASAAKKARERELELLKHKQLLQIESQRTANINDALSNLSSRIGAALRVPTVRI